MKAMAERIESAGGQIHLRTPVQEVVIEQGIARGLVTALGFTCAFLLSMTA